MKMILRMSAMILLIAVGSSAQQPGQPGVRTRLQSVAAHRGPPATTNYQLELTIQRGEKVARYKLALNDGSVSTELMDRFAERFEGAPPFTFNFNASLIPFDEGGGGEVTVFLGRNIPFKTRPSGTDKEVLSSKSIGLSTKVALRPGKPVTIFEDEDEKISLKLTELDDADKR